MSEIKIGLTPKQSQFDKLISKVENVFYGGAKGGGKSHGLREIMLKRRMEIAGSTGVIFRKTWPAVRDNHLAPLLHKFPALKSRYIAQDKGIHLENGSTLLFRYCETVKDLEKHQGQEYHDLAIEEAGEWSEDWFDYLKGSNRSGRPGIHPRCLITGNPGGIGHKWLKRLFIDRNFRANENPANYAFIPATVHDNPALMVNDPGYIDRLKANKNPMLVKAYLEGSWDIMAGQFFDMVSRETHFIEPFTIPDHWERMGMFDTGYNHPAAFLWLATDTDGNSYIYREYARSKRRTEEVVKDLMEFPDTFKLTSIPAGWDCWSKHGGGPSVEEKFSEVSGHRLVLHKANIDRIPGAQQVRDYLSLREGKPRLFIFKTCPMIYDCLTRMVHDTKHPEDVLKVDASDGDPWTGDDLYDCVRMGLMDRPRISIDPPKPRRKMYYDDDAPTEVSWTTV